MKRALVVAGALGVILLVVVALLTAVAFGQMLLRLFEALAGARP